MPQILVILSKTAQEFLCCNSETRLIEFGHRLIEIVNKAAGYDMSAVSFVPALAIVGEADVQVEVCSPNHLARRAMIADIARVFQDLLLFYGLTGDYTLSLSVLCRPNNGSICMMFPNIRKPR